MNMNENVKNRILLERAKLEAAIGNSELSASKDAYIFLVFSINDYKYLYRSKKACDVHNLIISDLKERFGKDIDTTLCSRFLNKRLVLSENVSTNVIPWIVFTIFVLILGFVSYDMFDINAMSIVLSVIFIPIISCCIACIIETIVCSFKFYSCRKRYN